jgi:signal transduction histidine kinase
MRPQRFGHRPHWWPENEPWPAAAGARHGYAVRRRHFARRFGLLFAVFLILSAIGAGTLISFIGRRTFVQTGLSAVAVAGAAFWILLIVFAIFVRGMRRVAVPLSDVVAAAGRVGEGDFSVRLREVGPPFLRSTAHAFNVMTSGLQAQDEERRRLMADVAHELRTPLSVLQGRLEGILDGVYARDDETLKEALEETRVLGRLVEDLRLLATAESHALALEREPTDFAILIRDLVGSFSAPATHGVAVRADSPADLPLIDVDPIRIRQVLMNLVENALRHTPSGGTVSIRLERVANDLVIRVADTGRGIAPADLPRIFDRFYKDPASRGSGLGLPIARGLIVAHGGQITAASQPGRGTTITVTLPLSSA